MLREAAGIERIIIRCGRTDLRYGIDRLASLIQVEYGLDPLEEGTLFLFCGNKTDRIKGLLYEDSGFLLLTKRLSNGAFIWPRSISEARELSRSSFDALLRGYEVTSSIKIYPQKGILRKGADDGKWENMQNNGDPAAGAPASGLRDSGEKEGEKAG